MSDQNPHGFNTAISNALRHVEKNDSNRVELRPVKSGSITLDYFKLRISEVPEVFRENFFITIGEGVEMLHFLPPHIYFVFDTFLSKPFKGVKKIGLPMITSRLQMLQYEN